MEVDAVRRGQPKAAVVRARRDGVRTLERTCERLRRAVAGGECDLGHRAATQLVGCALQQEPPPERGRRLSQRGADEPVEVEAAQEAAPCELLAARPITDAVEDDVDERPEPIARHGEIMRRSRWTRLIAFAEVRRVATRDHWAEWILSRRFGGDAAEAEASLEGLKKVRDRVLDRAEL